MRWFWGKRTFAGAAFGAYEVWVAVDWSLPDGALSALRFGPAEYAGLITFGALCIIMICAPLLNSLRPSKRFHSKVDLITMSMEQYIADLADSKEKKLPASFTFTTKTTIREMAFTLDDLEVPYPSLTNPKELDDWYVFFPRLLAAARVRIPVYLTAGSDFI